MAEEFLKIKRLASKEIKAKVSSIVDELNLIQNG